ncbi:unnamed protein product [Rhizoctonia solani]|uniref:Uncharacterized protein n=1 Tax=Rhizoctonia solani TaxID=456999 RepID=A0A8H3BEU1_9AGAM|nr:unnamed protein product [Rhizoctonia solani]CAE7097636.1 unnamed protein product [Rhizoctonia solani]
MVPTPPPEPGKFGDGMMVYRQFSEKREYLPPLAKVDFNGPKTLDRLIGLKVSEWRTIWFNEDSVDVPYEAEFLKPENPEDENQLNGLRDGKKQQTKNERSVNFDQGTCTQVSG